jgi:hypothetical protein
VNYNRRVIVNAAAITAFVAVATFSRGRIVKLAGFVRAEILRRNLNVKYQVLLSKVDALAELQSIMFFDRHRAYFNKRAEFYRSDVRDRGLYLLDTRMMCQGVFAMIMLREIVHQHADELLKLNARRAEKLSAFVYQLDQQAEHLFAQLNAVDLPVDLIIEEYETAS